MLKHDTQQIIVERAHASGVQKMISVSTESEDWEANKTVAETFPNVYFSLGVHPHETKTWDTDFPALRKYFPGNTPPAKCVGIGETGLDFYYNHSPRENQIQAFEDQIQLAKEVDLPLIIHCRDAYPELYTSLKKIGLGKKLGVLHCFTGTTEEALKGVDLGLKVSFSGIYTFKTAANLRETSKRIPLSHLLMETDCPFLTPVPHRGKDNEPSYLPFTAQFMADTLGLSLAEVGEITSQNAATTFGLVL